MIEDVNEEYLFWRPHRLVSNEDVTLNQIRTEIVSNENVVISNLNVAAAAATNDDDEIHSQDEEYPDEEDHHKKLVGVLDGTRQDILNVESNIDSNNYDDKSKERIVLPSSVSRLVKDDTVMINEEVISNLTIAPLDDSNLNCIQRDFSFVKEVISESDDANPPPLPPESLDNSVWNLEKDRSNDDNNNFNYDDIDNEILQFEHEDSTGESETIVFYDCDDDADTNE